MRPFLTSLLLFLVSLVFGQTNDLWEKHVFPSSNGTTLPYRLMRPVDMKPETTYPLVIFLHGAGERGTDNEKQLVHVARAFADSAIRADYPAFVLFPQVAPDKWWSNGEYNRESGTVTINRYVAGDHLVALMQLKDSLLEALPVDGGRVYIGGLSLGGFGTWDALARWSDQFAAAFPICGAGDPNMAMYMAGVPLWVFHGSADAVVPPMTSRKMVEALREMGSPVIYTEFPGVNHNSWDPAFENRLLFDWLFAQRRW